VPVEAPRGSIVDRAGRTIVSNVPGTAVQIWTADLPKEGRYAMFKKLSAILRVPLPRLTKALEESKDDPLTPILVKTAVHEDQVMVLKEHRDEFPGVEIVGTYLRNYEYRTLAAQVLGYVGEISPDELKRLEKDGYRGGEKIGKTGVEAAFDSYLRGNAGAAQLRVNSLGVPQGAFELRRPATPGQDRRPDDRRRPPAHSGSGRSARGSRSRKGEKEFNANGGAIVALDPRDGAVLAMASNPTYKPSVYVGPGRPEEARAAHGREGGEAAQLPGHQPCDRRRLPARVDVQAADGARCDLGRAALAVRVHPVHALRRVRPRQAGVQELEPVHERADVADDRARAVLRHVFLRRRQPLLHARRARAEVLDGDAGVGAEVRIRPGAGDSTSAARRRVSCRRRPGARRRTRASTAPGTRAT
jgi:hypothetical protein